MTFVKAAIQLKVVLGFLAPDFSHTREVAVYTLYFIINYIVLFFSNLYTNMYIK